MDNRVSRLLQLFPDLSPEQMKDVIFTRTEDEAIDYLLSPECEYFSNNNKNVVLPRSHSFCANEISQCMDAFPSLSDAVIGKTLSDCNFDRKQTFEILLSYSQNKEQEQEQNKIDPQQHASSSSHFTFDSLFSLIPNLDRVSSVENKETNQNFNSSIDAVGPLDGSVTISNNSDNVHQITTTINNKTSNNSSSNGKTDSDSWECDRCTFLNVASSLLCLACNGNSANAVATQRRLSTLAATAAYTTTTTAIPKVCKRCTFSNSHNDEFCLACLNPLSCENIHAHNQLSTSDVDIGCSSTSRCSSSGGATPPLCSGNGWSTSVHLAESLAQQQMEESIRVEIIRKKCEQDGKDFIDLDFPMCLPNVKKDRNYFCCRPKNMKSSSSINWAVINDYVSPSDVLQGELGDCWFVSALSLLANRPELLDRILITKEYNTQGIYAFRFFYNGKWTPVVIDDRLPVIYDQFAFANSSNNLLWVALVEKAYAKLRGSYGNIISGFTCDALEDLTGAPCESVKFHEEAGDLDMAWARLLSFHQSGFLIGASCGIPDSNENDYVKCGLNNNHAYSVVDVKSVQRISLVQLRDPHGKSSWNGDWSSNSPLVTAQLRSELYPNNNGNNKRKKDADKNNNDGLFWLSFKDLCKYFNSCDICKHQEQWFTTSVPISFETNSSYCPTMMFEVRVSTSTWMFASLAPTATNNNKENAVGIGLLVSEEVTSPTTADSNISSSSCPCAQIWPESKRIVHTEVLATRSECSYFLLPFSLLNCCNNISSSSSSQKHNLIILSAHPISIRSLSFCPVKFNISLHSAIIFLGTPKMLNETVFVYSLTQKNSIFFLLVNNHRKLFFSIATDCSGSTGLASSRGSLRVKDFVPPQSRQLLMTLSSFKKTGYQMTTSYAYLQIPRHEQLPREDLLHQPEIPFVGLHAVVPFA